jgi:5-formyltetrahydrofolate cyclo-ligase
MEDNNIREAITLKKKQIRKEALSRRNQLSTEQVEYASEKICSRLVETALYAQADKLALYVPIKNEVNVMLMIEKALRAGKDIYLPRVTGDNMNFYHYEKDVPFVIGKYNIPEPASHEVLVPDERTLVVMPGAAFSKKCDRIGYGGGYYDRYLETYNMVKKVAVAYEFQIYEDIPAEATDIKPDYIIGEEHTYGHVN